MEFDLIILYVALIFFIIKVQSIIKLKTSNVETNLTSFNISPSTVGSKYISPHSY